MIIVNKIRPSDNQERDKRRAAGKDKAKKNEPFNKVLDKELIQPPPKK